MRAHVRELLSSLLSARARAHKFPETLCTRLGPAARHIFPSFIRARALTRYSRFFLPLSRVFFVRERAHAGARKETEENGAEREWGKSCNSVSLTVRDKSPRAGEHSHVITASARVQKRERERERERVRQELRCGYPRDSCTTARFSPVCVCVPAPVFQALFSSIRVVVFTPPFPSLQGGRRV